jgi:hypothetical protein
MHCNDYYIGATGPIGIGIPGLTGATGVIGPPGAQGPSQRGDPGPTGPTGPKSFIIEHPTNETKYLVHVCLEGPEGGIYYKGVGEITEGNSVTILLPEYCRNFGYDFTVSITAIYDGVILRSYTTTPVTNNQFTVFTNNVGGKFHWLVIGKRCDINEEMDKGCEIKGYGPYTFL